MGGYSEYRNREIRGPDSIANAIILNRQYPGNEFLSFLVVEGDTDRRFYKTFVDERKCNITVAFSKLTALVVLSILEQNNIPGILVIVDADFDVLEGKALSSPNVLFTDNHDLETMIVVSPALEKLLGEFGSENKITQFEQDTGKDVRTVLLESCMLVGYLRWVSLQKGFSLKFEGLDFSKFLDIEKLTIGETKLIKAIKDKSQRHDIPDEQIKISIQELKRDDHNLWHVCCGHDLVCILSVGLHKAIGTKDTSDITPERIESSLRLSYELRHFQRTQLYLSIQRWEEANKPFVVLRRE
jgi:hypothetical protein